MGLHGVLAMNICKTPCNPIVVGYIYLVCGVTWSLGDEYLQLPDYITPFANAQAFVYNTTMQATRAMSSVWEAMPSRHLPYWLTVESQPKTRVSAAVTSWECPYIYIFGGENTNGILMNNIWKGVLNRLSFKPVV